MPERHYPLQLGILSIATTNKEIEELHSGLGRAKEKQVLNDFENRHLIVKISFVEAGYFMW
jgi:hypothetical protein